MEDVIRQVLKRQKRVDLLADGASSLGERPAAAATPTRWQSAKKRVMKEWTAAHWLRALPGTTGDRDAGALSLSLRVFGWSEVDDCKYRCAWSQTDARLEKGLPPLQYHGKWAFIRMGDIQACAPRRPLIPPCGGLTKLLSLLRSQEPLSVLFSLANVAAHGAGLHHSGVISSTARHRCAHLLNPAWVRSDQAVATGGCG